MMEKDSLNVLILAAGLGTRLRPLTNDMPKPLVPVVDASILDLQARKARLIGNIRLHANAHYLAEGLVKTGLFEMAYPDKPFLNEFAVKTKLDIDKLQEYCNEEYLQCGLKIADDTLLIAVTETYSREDCDDLIDACVTFNEEQEGK